MAFLGSWCAQCGPHVSVDEDGCCNSCGCSAVGQGADEAHATIADLRSRIAKLEAVVDAARQWNECVERGFMSAMRPDVARARLLAALRALDEQDSGGSGAVQQTVSGAAALRKGAR